MKNDEDFELLGVIDGSVKAAMEALGDELEKYLQEAGEKVFGKKKEEKQKPKSESPFISLFKGFAELGGALAPKKAAAPKKPKADEMKLDIEKKKAVDHAIRCIWTTYKNFKKSHEMIAW